MLMRDYFKRKHDYGHLVKTMETMVKLSPRSFDCRLGLADAYKAKGDIKAYNIELSKISELMDELISRLDADQKVNTTLLRTPDMKIMQSQRALLLLKQGNLKQAESI